MALAGTELVQIIGTINSGLAASTEFVTTQGIANLNIGNTGSVSSPLTGFEQIEVFPKRSDGTATSIPLLTTTGSIAAIGSVSASALTGLELVPLLNTPVAGTSGTSTIQCGVLRYATTLQIGG